MGRVIVNPGPVNVAEGPRLTAVADGFGGGLKEGLMTDA